jgi:hypothetical protein
MKKELLILGKSPHFIKLLKKIYTNYQIYITSWRNPILYRKFDIIFICGFDYSCFHKNLNFFLNVNCVEPINYLNKITAANSKIIYINTKLSFAKYTFSRYYFAKVQLANLLNRKFVNTSIIAIPTISNNGRLFIFGNFISKKIFSILIFLGLSKNIELNTLKKKLCIKNIKFNNYKNYKLKGMMLKIPRSLLLDRLLRLILG